MSHVRYRGPGLTPDERHRRLYLAKKRKLARVLARDTGMHTIASAARSSRVAVSTIYRWISRGLPIQREKGVVLISRRDLSAWRKAHRAKDTHKRRRWDLVTR